MTHKIGNIEFKDTVICLAPMAGNSTMAFRGICREKGSSYAPTELVSARSIVYGGTDKSFRYLQIDPKREGTTCIQLFGFEPEDFLVAAKAICKDERLSAVDIIDINMGCPVTKVMKTGSGSALLRDPLRAAKIVEAVREVTEEYGKVCTVKTRTGLNEHEKTGTKVVRELVKAGAQAVCIHGRTASQMYHGEASIEDVAEIAQVVKEENPDCFFFANGDIKDGPSAKAAMEITGADGIMIGRAAIGNPWIFEEVRAYLGGREFKAPTPDMKCDMLIRQLEETAEIIGESTAVKEMRSIMPHYITGLKGSTTVKVELCKAETIAQVKAILEESRKQWKA